LSYSPNYIKIIEERDMLIVGNVACAGEMSNAYEILGLKNEGK
jgi:hypothetical protein